MRNKLNMSHPPLSKLPIPTLKELAKNYNLHLTNLCSCRINIPCRAMQYLLTARSTEEEHEENIL